MEMEEIYARKVSGTYPYNLLKSIFGRKDENTEEAKMDEELSAWLDEVIATKRKENAERETLEALEALFRK